VAGFAGEHGALEGHAQTLLALGAKNSVWEQLFTVMADDRDNKYAMIDATVARAHQHSAGAQKKTEAIKLCGAVTK